MAGFWEKLFGYNKDGPGVSKDEKSSPQLINFFIIYGRRFYKIALLSIFLSVAYLPTAALIYSANYIIDGSLFAKTPIFILLALPTALLAGPATAGATYVMRNFAREEHAFVWLDFKDQFKKNFRLASLFCAVDFTVILMGVYNSIFYFKKFNESFFNGIVFFIFAMLSVVYIFMRYYIYLMIVTFNIKFTQLIKNAIVLAVTQIFRNLLTTAASVLLWSFLLGFFPVTIPIIVTIGVGTASFIIVYSSYWPIKKVMIDPYMAEQAKTEEPKPKSKPIFTDTGRTGRKIRRR